MTEHTIMKISELEKHQTLFSKQCPTVARATQYLCIIIVLIFGGYIVFQATEGSLKDRCKTAYNLKELTPCLDKTPILTFKKLGVFNYQLNESALERFYDAQEVEAFKEKLADQVKVEKQKSLSQRLQLIQRFNVYVQLQSSGFALDGLLDIQVKNQSDLAEIERVNLSYIKTRVKALQAQNDCSLAISACDSQSNYLYLSILSDELDQLIAEDRKAKMYLKGLSQSLKPQLNFTWLYHPGFGWIFELVFWCWFGLISCHVICLIKNVKNKDYDANIFALVFPRILLAPIMAIVIVALLASGYTEYNQNLNNFPYFLVLAFILGFNTENVNAIISQVSNKLLQPIAFSEEQRQKANKKVPYQKQYQFDEALFKPVKTIDDLKSVTQAKVNKTTEDIILSAVKKTPK